jgi:predicted  nucleic acid-binding Zn-ribbon protein
MDVFALLFMENNSHHAEATLNAMADNTTSASLSTSQGNVRMKRWPPDSPQNAAKRPRRKSIVERGQLLEEIQRAQEEIATLKEEIEQVQERSASSEEDVSDEETNVAALEAMLKEMDDGAL